ncbi:MAG TPA: glycoside hydrolase family 30 beta sandwich domain-containing protein [Chitinivibrionales bacterium]|nr:glycoside hydrolase family 30 beta sandwich domain-containing protein [Chitinivibrionales bacterium]
MILSRSIFSAVLFAGLLYPIESAISISGTVRDKTTQLPVQGAIVSLADTGLTCLTDQNGKYAFGDALAVLPAVSAGLSAVRPYFTGNRLVLEVGNEPAQVQVDLYTLSGRHVTRILDRQLTKGIHRLDPFGTQEAAQPYLVKVKIGSGVTILKASIVAGRAIVADLKPRSGGAAATAGLSKTGTFPDTLLAWAVGYEVSRVTAGTSPGTYDIDLQSSVPAGQVQVIHSSMAGDNLVTDPAMTFGADDGSALPTITITPASTYQSITGFGGAFTETATYNLSNISAARRAEVLNAFFNPFTGAGYTVCRTPINSCDFSVANYAYDVTPGDYNLNNFDFSHDLKWTVPVIRQALRIPGAGIKIFGSPWSPPAWMKTNNSMFNGGELLSTCFSAWALYYVKYIQSMRDNGVPMWGLTVQNEPQAVQTWESCIYSTDQERDFVKNYLGPTLAQNNANVNLMIWDHNKDIIVERVTGVMSDPNAAKYVWGVAYHKYAGDYFDSMDVVHTNFPNAWMLGTENSIRDTGTDAERMAHEVIGNLNHWSVGYLVWNLCTNYDGGPYQHRTGGSPGPIVVDSATDGVKYLRQQYYMTQFSRYLRPGAVRIGCALTGGSSLEPCAFKNTDGFIAVTVLNRTANPVAFKIKQGTQIIKPTIPAWALMSFIY